MAEEAVKSFNAVTEVLRQDAERLTAQLQEQGARDAASLRETASKLAETSEALVRRLEAGVQAAETAINPRSGTPAEGTHIGPRKCGVRSPRPT